ncbi:uncharacterized protein BO95DRAFT_464180 [Aspergillus brunneoviolaceus CBS 621.78]|uniref:Uncharacterized protein n=1 Tax=Aspergillus brunneoviolaceus CBS 621.78 TaxID=1450534 RepID=A0ACD1G889_9EURO|nr:hypothetical protein BO95DRAFT_464180 [Aspergillus brunneoviolaceus CBS 621.78]RAH45378.1 hypothetical protein BO95DRAFT_464180 [Aspergillus brunneoviolaceus CBS 621.78]
MAVSSRGVELAIWIAVFTLLTTLILGLRFWAIAITRPYELGVQYQLIVASSVTWLMGTVCCKLSILSRYASLFPSRGLTRMLWTAAACVVAYFKGYCRSLYIQEILSISINMIIDTGIALLPIPALWKLKMATRNKLTITIMFGLGLIVVAVMALRLRITLDPTTNLDFVYGLYPVALVSFLELWLSMIIVCLPVLAPLYRRYIEPYLYCILGSSGNAEAPLEAPLREGQHTFGSEPVHRRPKHNDAMMLDCSLDVDEDGELRSLVTKPPATSRVVEHA